MAHQHNPGFLRLVHDAERRIYQISAEEVKARLAAGEKLTILDVREDHEWALGHLPTAEHLGRGILERDIETRHPDWRKEIILYCGGGYRSTLAADNLGKMGYVRVLSMTGGWRGWKDKNFPTEGGP